MEYRNEHFLVMRGLDLTLLHERKVQAKNSEAGVISFHCLSIFFSGCINYQQWVDHSN